jgi:hypothetical protein
MTAKIDQACALAIEQEIKAGLAAGKKPWTIGQDLSKWVEKIFEVTINPNTIRMRAERTAKKDCTNVQKESNISNKSIDCETDEDSVTHPKTNRGGERSGSGRPKIMVETAMPETVSDAWRYSQMAISQLDRIKSRDPNRVEALNQVIEYCENRKERAE